MAELDDKLTEDQLDEMIEEIDTDGSGTVDLEGNVIFTLKILLLKRSSFLLSYQKRGSRSLSKQFLTRSLRRIECVHVAFSPSREGIPFIQLLT